MKDNFYTMLATIIKACTTVLIINKGIVTLAGITANCDTSMMKENNAQEANAKALPPFMLIESKVAGIMMLACSKSMKANTPTR